MSSDVGSKTGDTGDTGDKSFDGLAQRFQANIYNSLKGKIREAVLWHDLEPVLASKDRFTVFDAGGGLGRCSIQLAGRGHQVTYCDLSAEMVSAAQTAAEEADVKDIVFIHGPMQQQLENFERYDLVLVHVVLEWLDDPQAALQSVLNALAPGAYLSLMFYNIHSVVLRNLIRGNFYRACASDQSGQKGSLTPINPLDPATVHAWLAACKLNVVAESGVRVFYDYRDNERMAQRTEEQIIATELQFSQQDPYRPLGRYYHLLLQKN